MTPKEKAHELYNKFLRYVPAEQEFEHEYAKQCVLIAVDERIDEMYEWMGGGGYDWEKKRFQYWEEVKQEIEKL